MSVIEPQTDSAEYLGGPLPQYLGDATVEIDGESIDMNAVEDPFDVDLAEHKHHPKHDHRPKKRGRHGDVAAEPYQEAAHPRSRTGEWTDAGHPPEATVAKAKKKKHHQAPGTTIITVKDIPAPLPKPTISPEVAGITTAAQANDYLAKRFGITARLGTGPGAVKQKVSADFYQQICQGVTDAEARYPTLSNPANAYTFAGLGFASQMTDIDGPGLKYTTEHGVWATSGFYPDATGTYHVDITLNDKTGLLDTLEVQDNYMSIAGYWPYGMIMHELGHAITQTSGFVGGDDDATPGAKMVAAYAAVGLTPAIAKEISRYGATDPQETWAEIVSVINTPGALDYVKKRHPDAAAAIARLQASYGTYNGQKIL